VKPRKTTENSKLRCEYDFFPHAKRKSETTAIA
jgi:hypothetical protein